MTKDQAKALRLLRYHVEQAEKAAAGIGTLAEIPDVGRLLARLLAAKAASVAFQRESAPLREALESVTGVALERLSPAEIGSEIRRIAGVG